MQDDVGADERSAFSLCSFGQARASIGGSRTGCTGCQLALRFFVALFREIPHRQPLTEHRLRGEAHTYFPAAACAKWLTLDTAAVRGEMQQITRAGHELLDRF